MDRTFLSQCWTQKQKEEVEFMKKKVANQLKMFAAEESVLFGRGDISWLFYKKLRRLYTSKKIFLKNGVPFWRLIVKPVELMQLMPEGKKQTRE